MRHLVAGASKVALAVVGLVATTWLTVPADASGPLWHYGLSPEEINSLVHERGIRLADLRAHPDPGGPTRFDVAVVADTGERPWSWSYDLTAGRMQALMEAAPRHPVVIVEYEVAPGDTRLAAVWEPGTDASARIDTLALEDITARVSALLAVTDGTQGLYLKEVGGPVLANQNESAVFEPASTIKAAAGLHAMRQVEAGTWSLDDLVDIYQPPAFGSCPTNTDIGDETLANAMREMLWHSDNQRTRVIVDTFGQANINNTMLASGMTSSGINHVIGCGGPPENQLTLVDAGALYEGVADGTLISPGNADLFRTFFAGRGQFTVEGYDWTGIWDTDIPNMILQEAPAGMTSSQRQAYRDLMDVAYKAGGYKICVNGTCSDYRDHLSIAGWSEVAFCTGTLVDPREFVFGIFIYNSTSDTTSGQAFTSAKGELLREQIRDGIATCFHAELSLASAAVPDPVLSGHDFAVTIDAQNAGPMEATTVTVTGSTPPGTTFGGASADAGWSTSAPAAGGTGPITFSDDPMLVGATPRFEVALQVDCAIPDGQIISFGTAIASPSTPDEDPSNNVSTTEVLVSNPAPIVGPVSADPDVLWAPDHKMVEVAVNYAVEDNCGTPACSLSVTSSEPGDGVGDGHTQSDSEIVDTHTVRLRAERAGKGFGRTYTITVTCEDSGGGSSSAQTSVLVPHNP